MKADDTPLMLHQFPMAIIHLDADAFFTSVEQSTQPELKNRPVVTGKERGIIACASYEAKRCGVKRGLSLLDAKRMCADLVVLPSDYETYSIYSKRMFNIMRRYTPVVEESSVDEAYADLSGMRRVFHASYEQIADRIRQKIHEELDITVSVGLSVSKILAKLASSFRKPDGLTAVDGMNIHLFLKRVPLGDICGIGPNGVALFGKFGVRTAYDFVKRDEKWVAKLVGKPGREIWNELRGNSVYEVTTQEQATYLSISKTKTFSAPSRDRDFVYARLIRNVESAFIKLRRNKLKTCMVGVLLRYSDYNECGFEAKLNRATSSTQEVIPLVKHLFDRTYEDDAEYRSAMVFLDKLEDGGSDQPDLFEDRLRIENMARASAALDDINSRYGKHAVTLGTSLFLGRGPKNEKNELPVRRKRLLDGETDRQRVNIPIMMVDV